MALRALCNITGRSPATLPLLLLGCWISMEANADPGPATAEAAQERHSISRQYADGGRDATSLTTMTDDRFGALLGGSEQSKAGGAGKDARLSGTVSGSEALNDDFWVYYADVQLFNDHDHDGYYHGIDVLFDADTIYETADVYAVLYLSFEGGPWNEYATTDTFRIFGATSDDEYVVVTELMTGYPRGNYDLLIDVYDTFDGQLVATFGPEGSSTLSYLPLEDFDRDDPDRGDTVVVVDGGGGAFDLWSVLAVLSYLLVVYLVRRRQRDA